MKEIALKGARAEINVITTWFQAGTVSKELPGIGWPINVFLGNTAAVFFQAGCREITPRLRKAWSLAQSVISTRICAVIGVTISV